MSFYNYYRWILNLPSFICNRLTFYRKHIKWSGKLRIWGRARIFGNGTVQIGRNVTIISNVEGNPTGGTFSAFVTYSGSRLLIGDNTGISNSTINVRQFVKIGSNSLIGANCLITDNDFHPVNWLDRRENQLGNISCSPVVIGDDVFIGARCIILKGVHIGSHSVIGAGSVVTHNVPEDEIWAGNPAHFVKRQKR